MTDTSRPQIVKALPAQPLTNEAVEQLGESEATVATISIKNRHNNLITEFLLVLDDGIYAIAFDPDGETWQVLERRSHDGSPSRELEEDLMGVLYEWRKTHVLPRLVENDLIPAFELD